MEGIINERGLFLFHAGYPVTPDFAGDVEVACLEWTASPNTHYYILVSGPFIEIRL